MEGGCDAQFDAFRPDRVVIVLAVEAKHVVPHRKTRRVGVVGRRRRHLARHVAAEHADLRSQLLGDEFELGDRLVGRVHRDDCRRGQPVAEAAEIIGRNDVVGADYGAPGRVVLDARKAQSGGRQSRGPVRRGGRTTASASSRWRGRACFPPGAPKRPADRRACGGVRRPTSRGSRGSGPSPSETPPRQGRRRPCASCR